MNEPYFLITKEELDMIKNDCAYPDRFECGECKYHSNGDLPCTFKGANVLMDEVLERPLTSALEESYRHGFNDGQAEGMPTSTPPKSIHPEKYGECGLTVGLCACVQENKGIPEKDCEYCYGTGVSVYTNIELPTPINCPHWINDAIYVKGFRCSLYRDINRVIHDTTIRKAEREKMFCELEKLKASTDMGDIIPWCDVESLRSEP